MLLLGWTKSLRHYRSIALLRVTLASLGKLCISNFQGLARLSLWDSLRSSTQEGRIVPGLPRHLGETLLLWKSKDKKCCLYETPYVAGPIWVLGDVVAKFSALCVTNFGCTYKNQIFFGSQVTGFWRDPSCHIKSPTWNFYEEVYKQKWYQKGLLIILTATATYSHC